jgi:hypothetical protein
MIHIDGMTLNLDALNIEDVTKITEGAAEILVAENRPHAAVDSGSENDRPKAYA